MTGPIIRSSFTSHLDEFSGLGKRPVVFDILGPDRETSILPEDLYLVLHTNPTSMKFSYQKNTIPVQTRGGFVEFHWGDSVEEISFDLATGGFVRLTGGLSNKTGSGLIDQGGEQARRGRRETIAYDKYLDLLALFKNNGAVYDTFGNIAAQGCIKITFDGGIYIGWFENFNVTEEVSKPYQFAITTNFKIDQEILAWRSTIMRGVDESLGYGPQPELAQEPIFDSVLPPGGFNLRRGSRQDQGEDGRWKTQENVLPGIQEG